MNKRALWVGLLAVAAVATLAGLLAMRRAERVEAQARSRTPSIAAVAGLKGGQDVTGPYEVVPDWPKPLSQLPGHANWTYSAVQSIYAESPDRVFLFMRGEIPKLDRPREVPYPQIGPSISFPVSQTPFRNASVGPVTSPGQPGPWLGKMGVDSRWEDCLLIVDSAGNIKESWKQYDSRWKRPHYVAISPYDAQKHVWLVDDMGHAVYELTNDGKQIVKTLGVPNTPGTDETHFNRPTFLAWLPDGTLFV